MKQSPIFILQGQEREWITNLLKQGTPKSLKITTEYVPSEEDKEEKITPFDQLTDEHSKQRRIKGSIVRALVNKEYEMYIVDRPSVNADDLRLYLEIGNLYDCTPMTVCVTSEDVSNSTDKGVVFISGSETEELISLLRKGAERSERLLLTQEQTLEESEKSFYLTEALDMEYMRALVAGVDLVILDSTRLTTNDIQTYKRLGKAAKFRIKTIKVGALEPSVVETSEDHTGTLNWFQRQLQWLTKPAT